MRAPNDNLFSAVLFGGAALVIVVAIELTDMVASLGGFTARPDFPHAG
jgi:hypothetical protein|tara:strand:- start:27 stop:170 length:144 start_codon:yes stop_codon:yes gene_type:complete